LIRSSITDDEYSLFRFFFCNRGLSANQYTTASFITYQLKEGGHVEPTVF